MLPFLVFLLILIIDLCYYFCYKLKTRDLTGLLKIREATEVS